MNSLISVIIPTFNRSLLIRETLDSVLNQTYQNWECIVVDDGSVDGTQDVVDQYITRDSRFKLLQRLREPKGASTCRNIGLENCSGDYVIFLDSDDLLRVDCLSRRIKTIGELPGFDFWVFSTAVLDSEGRIHPFGSATREDALIDFVKHNNPWTITGPIWSVQSLRELKGFKEYYPRLQDPEIHTRALLRGFRYHYDATGIPDHFYRKGMKSHISIEQYKNILNGAYHYITDVTLLSVEHKNKQEIQLGLRHLYLSFNKRFGVYSNVSMNSSQFFFVYNKFDWFTHSQQLVLRFQFFLKKKKLINIPLIRNISWQLWRIMD